MDMYVHMIFGQKDEIHNHLYRFRHLVMSWSMKDT